MHVVEALQAWSLDEKQLEGGCAVFKARRLRGWDCDDRLPARSFLTGLPFQARPFREMAIDAQGDDDCAKLLESIR